MRGYTGLSRWIAIASVALFAWVLSACGDDPPQIIDGDDANECGGQETLEYDGEEAEPGDSCGECGELACLGENELHCSDPGANECGGCEELDDEPGDSCTTADDEDGIWECDGDNDVVCVDPGLNACGGTETLDAEPGDSCGDCMLDRYECAGSDDVQCEDDIGCPQASDVEATQGEHAGAVVVTWRGSVYAEAYRIYRDGDQIGEVSAGNLSYTDEDADPAGAPEDLDLTASDDETDGVHLEWSHGDGAVSEHEYEVEIVFPEAISDRSDSALGWAGAEVDHYEISVDDGNRVYTQDEGTSFVDTQAAYATVDDVTPTVDETGWDFITLEASPQIVDAAEHDYEVSAVVDGQTGDAATDTGQRAHGDADYTWWHAEEDGDVGDFDEMTDCADTTDCTEDFPVDSDVAEKYYRFSVDGDGIDETVSDSVNAGVDLLDVVPDDISDLMIGEEATISVQLVDPDDGSSVGRQDATIDIDVSADDAVSGDLPGPVDTDADGYAEDQITFDQEAQDVIISWTADDPRVTDDTVDQQPFDVVAEPADGDSTSMVALDTTAELLANDDDYTIVEIEVRDGDDEPISGASIDADVASGATLFDCDEFTDSDGTARCSIRADEPGSYDVNLTAPTSMTLEDVGPFYATADDYDDVEGDIYDAAVFGDYLVIGGENLEAGGESWDGWVFLDRVSGEMMGNDKNIDRVDALVFDDDDLFVLGDGQVHRNDVDSVGTSDWETSDDGLGDLMVVDGDYVAVFESDSGDAVSLNRDDLSEEDTTLGLFDSAEIDAVRAADSTVFALGFYEDDLLFDEDKTFATYDLPGLDTDEYLDVDDVDGSIDFFDIGDSNAHFVAGGFDDIHNEGVEHLARLNDDGTVHTGFDPEELPVVDGGLFYTDGMVFSAGRLDGSGGAAYDADNGDLVADHSLDNDYAWGAIVDTPRHFVLFGDIDGEDPSTNFEIVLRPDVDVDLID